MDLNDFIHDDTHEDTGPSRELIDAILEHMGPDTSHTERRQMIENIAEEPTLLRAHQMADIAQVRAMLDEVEAAGHYKALLIGIVHGHVGDGVTESEVQCLTTGDMLTGLMMAQNIAKNTTRQFLEASVGNFVIPDDGFPAGFERTPIPDDIARAFSMEED